MFAKAVRWKWISDNPFEEAEAPTLELRDWQHINADEYNALLDVAATLRWQVSTRWRTVAGCDGRNCSVSPGPTSI